MSCAAGPVAVTNGLVLELDAANIKSFGPLNVETLVVGGGGGGGGTVTGAATGGGGGGGGVLYSSALLVTAGTAYTVTVGAGGTGNLQTGNYAGTQGGNSTFSSLTALGGGYGSGCAPAGTAVNAGTGGSGGGAHANYGAAQPRYGSVSSAAPTAGSGTVGQGNAGGLGYDGADVGGQGGGGGGGAGGGGGSGRTLYTAGAGGVGLQYNISGISTYFGGGGGGGMWYYAAAGGAGGLGGGGNGASFNNSTLATAGTANTGGGGGGGGSGYPGATNAYSVGKDGSTGVVIIRYAGPQKATGGTITTNNSYTIHTFTTSGTFTPGANWADTSGNNIVGTLTNGPAYNPASSGSIVLDGVNDYIDRGSDLTIKATGGWTIESWVKYTLVAGTYNNVNSPANFIGSESTSYNSWYWSVLENKLALWNISPGGWYYGSTIIQPNTWYHCVLVCNDAGTGYQMYLNGVAEGGTHVAYSWNASYAGLLFRYVGKGNSVNTRYLTGNVATTKIYNRALTASEVAQNYNSTKSRYFTPGTINTNPAPTASAILSANPSASNGVYWLQPDGQSTPFQAYCDFTTANGPWVHVGTAVGNTFGLYTYKNTWANRTTNSGDITTPFGTVTSSFNAGSFMYCKGSNIMIQYSTTGYVQASGFSSESWRDVYSFLNFRTAWPAYNTYQRELTITVRSGVVSNYNVTGAGLLYGTEATGAALTTYAHWYVYAFDAGGDTYAYLTTGTYGNTGFYNEADHGIGANENGPAASVFPGDDYALSAGLAFDAGTNDAIDSGGAATYNGIPFSLWIKN
jgi:hypothetical protein